MKYIKLLIPAAGLIMGIGFVFTVQQNALGIAGTVVIAAFVVASTYLILKGKW